jgi:FixJ family two-component response regulator
MSTKAIVYVVEDDPGMRDALSRLLKAAGLQVETFVNAQTFLEVCPPYRPGCLILDIRMPGMSGLELQKILTEQGIHLPTIVITGHGDVPMAVRAMKTGALDVIQKPFCGKVLLERVLEALAQDEQTCRQQTRYDIIARRMALLSSREQEVLEQVVAGQYNKVIAIKLGISVSTVEAHRKRIMEKLQAKSLTELICMWNIYHKPKGKPD